MKKFMKLCGIDFLFCCLLFLYSAYLWFRYGLRDSFDANSACFGLVSGSCAYLFGSSICGVFKYFKDRKSSAPADENINSVKE